MHNNRQYTTNNRVGLQCVTIYNTLLTIKRVSNVTIDNTLLTIDRVSNVTIDNTLLTIERVSNA